MPLTVCRTSAALLVGCALAAAGARAETIQSLSVDFEENAADAKGRVTLETSGVKYVEGKTGKAALLESGSAASMACATEGVLNIKKGAIEFWLKPDWHGAEKKAHCLFMDSEEYFRLVKSEWDAITFQVFRADWQQALSLSVPVRDWKAGEWHHVKAEWDMDGESILTVDDKSTAKGWMTFGNSTVKLGSKMFFGTHPRDAAKCADSAFDELRIYVFK